MNQSIKSRIAPTPSGFLHIGNAFNFLITYRETVIKREGELMLRIDDSDSTRIRDSYIEDIFASISWLGIPITEGPKNVIDFKNNFSQLLKKDRYFEFVERLPNTYVCDCSRSFLKENHCPCFEKKLSFNAGKNAIRLKNDNLEIKEEMGDFILWRKDDLPSYQVASLVDDIDNKINLIIRGEDLLASTRAQFLIAELAGDKIFTSAHFLHHPLIKNSIDQKISKSGEHDNSPLTLKKWREDGKTREDVLRFFGFNCWEEFLNG